MKYLIMGILALLQGCNPWSNNDEAILKSSVELDGEYYSFYTQEMWDGTIQFLIKSGSDPSKVIESPLGEPKIDSELIVINDFKQANSPTKASLNIKNNTVVFCSASGCKNITKTIRRPI